MSAYLHGWNLRLALPLAILAASGAPAQTIENELLAVEFNGGELTVKSRPAGMTFIPHAAFLHAVTKASTASFEDPVWGKGTRLELLHVDGWKTEVRLYSGNPFVHFHTVAGNNTGEPVAMTRTELMEYAVNLGIPLEKIRTLGTGGLRGVQAPGSYTYSAVVDPETRRGVVAAWLTHERGVGVFFPKLSPNGSEARVATRIEFGQLQVDPGTSRPVDTMLLGYFQDARLGLEAYADAVARQYAIKLPPTPAVYCTWYHAGASSEPKIEANTVFAAKHLKPFGLKVMQIDDGWQAILPKKFPHEGKIKTTGPVKVFVDSKANYPKGMAYTAGKIASYGMVAGLWFMPFAGNYRNPYFDPDLFATNPDGTPFHDARWSGTCLDLSRPKTQAFVAERVRRIYKWGYRYFKLDGMHTGACCHNIYVNREYREGSFSGSQLHDPHWTQIQAYRKGMQIVRRNAPDAVILGCCISQNMFSMGPAFGLVDAMRIGPDNGGAARGRWSAVKAGAWHGTNLYFLNGRVWHNDPDPVYVRPGNPLSKARLMCSWVAVSGAMLTTSCQFADLPEDRLDLLRRTLPPHGLRGRPADIFDSDQASIWLLTDTRRSVRRDVIGLFNWQEDKPASITYDLGRLGLDGTATYAAFDFWENKFLEPMRGTLSLSVPEASCRVLAVRPVADHPQLLSTSRHIAQCMVDVLEETWDATARVLRGKSLVVAGDRYELRVALPPGGTWQARKATAGGKELTAGTAGSHGMRFHFTPQSSGVVEWAIRF